MALFCEVTGAEPSRVARFCDIIYRSRCFVCFGFCSSEPETYWLICIRVCRERERSRGATQFTARALHLLSMRELATEVTVLHVLSMRELATEVTMGVTPELVLRGVLCRQIDALVPWHCTV